MSRRRRPRARETANPAPRPAAVRYNDWRDVSLLDTAAFTPARPVSAIVPCHEAPEALALTLAGLERQAWPRELLEVVVVDDGSDPPLERPACTSLDLRVVRQDRRGFGLARARNTGVRAAAHDILVFLDGDAIAEAGLIAAHARWHHAVADAVTLGFCNYVSVAGIGVEAVRARPGSLAELFAGRPFDAPWLERHMARTGDLTSRHDDLFRAVTGHNFAISRAFFEEAGGFDESFTRYGGEDTEFAYRAQVRGGLLVPVREAAAWHQGRWADGRREKERDLDRQAAKLADLIADPGFRPASAGRRYTVPRHVVTIDAGHEPADRVVQAADALLADPAADLALCIEVPVARCADRDGIERRFGHDPRVRVAPGAEVSGEAAPAAAALDAFPASPVHIALPAGAVAGPAPAIGPGAIARLAAALGEAAAASAVLDDGTRVSVARAWALNRARRAGGRAADYGDSRRLPARVLRGRLGFSGGHAPGPARAAGGRTGAAPRSRRSQRAGMPPRRRGALAVLARVWAEARHVRGLRTLWRFLRWLASAVRWRLRQGRGWAATALPAATPLPAAGAARPEPPLGARIAVLGPRARAVFAASSRVMHEPGARPADVTVADSAAEAHGVRSPLVLLRDAPSLSVPALNPAVDNPIGWVRDVEPRAAALGPARRLPPGVTARRTVARGNRAALRHCHHLEDVAAFHSDAVQRAGTLARIAAWGVPVRLADGDAALADLLGAELHALMSADVRHADGAAREAFSIATRRAALRSHSLCARARQVCEAAGIDPPAPPRISVLLATCRPGFLTGAVANVARQTYPRIELVLALHGPGFEPGAVDAALARFTHPVNVLRLPRDQPLGAVLNAASAAAVGPLLAKMDDDDVYGREHLWDLALAHEYSGAALVGKFPATVYLAGAQRTVRCRAVASETWSCSITGGTMLLARADLERAGGWRAVRRHVDEALIEDIVRIGGGVYRTHDAGYVLVRHGDRHTWRRDDADFLATAEAVHAGWQPALAGIEAAAPPRPTTGT